MFASINNISLTGGNKIFKVLENQEFTLEITFTSYILSKITIQVKYLGKTDEGFKLGNQEYMYIRTGNNGLLGLVEDERKLCINDFYRYTLSTSSDESQIDLRCIFKKDLLDALGLSALGSVSGEHNLEISIGYLDDDNYITKLDTKNITISVNNDTSTVIPNLENIFNDSDEFTVKTHFKTIPSTSDYFEMGIADVNKTFYTTIPFKNGEHVIDLSPNNYILTFNSSPSGYKIDPTFDNSILVEHANSQKTIYINLIKKTSALDNLNKSLIYTNKNSTSNSTLNTSSSNLSNITSKLQNTQSGTITIPYANIKINKSDLLYASIGVVGIGILYYIIKYKK